MISVTTPTPSGQEDIRAVDLERTASVQKTLGDSGGRLDQSRVIYADLTGGVREPFRYWDKGYMAMVGRGAAVAELGRRRLQLQGRLASRSRSCDVSWIGHELTAVVAGAVPVRW